MHVDYILNSIFFNKVRYSSYRHCHDLLGIAFSNFTPIRQSDADNLARMQRSELDNYARMQRSEGHVENMKTILFPLWPSIMRFGKPKPEKEHGKLDEKISDQFGEVEMAMNPELIIG